ncbi:hypothetical protein CPB84DRAFT_1780397 [Gymnopilus junonius]|uniref:Uncharacterized protein n=1 Tax=Gymnopilus junonius TaxID=109634 RepID=A0A9P5NNJ3_GYMJU|nr:hypothetical protein CPB84DRAFT_1780397 [Gymnopilus junonius]
MSMINFPSPSVYVTNISPRAVLNKHDRLDVENAACMKMKHIEKPSETEQSSSDTTYSLLFSDSIHQPPPLVKPRPLPLPSLATEPILIHPLLTYSPSRPQIQYEIGSCLSTINLPSESIKDGYKLWNRQPAMDPPDVGSLTIRMAGVSRPIIIFPATTNDSVVTVEDVLKVVHRNVLVAVHDDPWWINRLQRRLKGHASGLPGRSNHAGCVSCFHSGLWWGGLYPSPDERDVWILHTEGSTGNLPRSL